LLNGVADDTAVVEEDISNALTLIVQVVREMASGLSLPEVGVNPDFCYQKFYYLRVNIIKHCLVPFCKRLVMEQRNIVAKGGGAINKNKDYITQV
jgi:hypothetical protein